MATGDLRSFTIGIPLLMGQSQDTEAARTYCY
jgi:hypothetical protein